MTPRHPSLYRGSAQRSLSTRGKWECGQDLAGAKSKVVKPQLPPQLSAVSSARKNHWATGKVVRGVDPRARKPAVPSILFGRGDPKLSMPQSCGTPSRGALSMHPHCDWRHASPRGGGMPSTKLFQDKARQGLDDTPKQANLKGASPLPAQASLRSLRKLGCDGERVRVRGGGIGHDADHGSSFNTKWIGACRVLRVRSDMVATHPAPHPRCQVLRRQRKLAFARPLPASGERLRPSGNMEHLIWSVSLAALPCCSLQA